MPNGDYPGSPGVIMTFARPSRLYAADGVTKKTLVHGVHTFPYTWQTAPANGDKMQLLFYAVGNETMLDISTHRNTDRAIWDLYVNGIQDSGPYDDYGTSLMNVRHITLTQPIKTGFNVLEIRINGKNAASSAYYVAVAGVSIQ